MDTHTGPKLRHVQMVSGAGRVPVLFHIFLPPSRYQSSDEQYQRDQAVTLILYLAGAVVLQPAVRRPL
jgi:hypothetical protein